MKNPKGRFFEYEHERNKDLMRAYKEQINIQFHSDEPIHLSKVFRKVAEMPSERFWVSEERAAIVISSMMKGDKLERMGKMKREMFFEIYKRTMRMMSVHPKQPFRDVVAKVCCSPAPRFYLTPKSVKVIIYKIKRKWYENRKQNSLISPLPEHAN